MSTTSIQKTISNESSLLARMRRVAKTAWLLSLGIHVAQAVLIVVGIGALLVAIDYSIRWNDWTMRLAQSSLFLAAVVLVLRYRIVVGLRRRPSLSMVAKKLEQVFSIPRGWLASLVDWKDGEPVESGISQELQANAMMTIEQAVHRHRLESILDPKPCIFWTMMAALCLAVLTGAAAFRPELANRSIARLVNPWSKATWPRMVHLEFVGLPPVLQQGSPLTVTAVNRSGEMPDDIKLWIRNESQVSEVGRSDGQVPMTTWSLSPQYESFELRLEGGDDTEQPWIKIRVAPATSLERYHFEITPPVYTNQSPLQLTGTRIDVLEGSRFRLHGTFSQAIRNLRLQSVTWPEGDSAKIGDLNAPNSIPYAMGSQGPISIESSPGVDAVSNNPSTPPMSLDSMWEMHLSDDRTTFVLELRDGSPIDADRSVQFGLQWESLEGLVMNSMEPFDIRVLRDQLPELRLVRPEDDLRISANSQLQVAMEASDDFGLLGVTLDWQHLEEDGTAIQEGQVDLFQEKPLSVRKDTDDAPFHWESVDALRRVGRGFWFPGSLAAMEPGHKFRFRMVARDTANQVSSTMWRTLHVEADEEILRRIASQQTALSRALNEAINNQRRALSDTQSLRSQIETGKSLDAIMPQLLDWHISHQKKVQFWTMTGESSAKAIIEQTVQQLREDDLIRSTDFQQWSNWQQRMDETLDEPLGRSIESIEVLEKIVREAPASVETQQLLNEIQSDQEAIEASLAEFLSELGQSSSLREFEDQIRSLASLQEQLAEKSQALMQSPSGEGQQGRKNELIGAQNDLARRVDSVRRSIAQQLKQSKTDETEGSPLNSLRQSLDQADLTQRMRDANALIQKDDFEQASDLQSKIARDLLSAAGQSNFSEERSATQEATDPSTSAEKLKESVERVLQQQSAIVSDLSELIAKELPKESQQPVGNTNADPWMKTVTRISQAQERNRKVLEKFLSDPNLDATFRWVGNASAMEMGRAMAALQRLQIEPLAMRHARTAESRLESILRTLEGRKPGQDNPEVSQEEQGSSSEQEDDLDKGSLPLESLILLRDVQESVRLRVEEIYNVAGDGKLSPEQWLEVNELAHQQQDLASQLQQIIDSQRK